MKRKLYFGLTLLMWLTLPLTALQFRQNWDRLPVHMATHFNAANQPNGWMTREHALWSSLEVLGIPLVIFTLLLVLSHRKREITNFSWALLAFAYVVVGLGWYISSGILNYNLHGHGADPGVVGIVFGVSLVGIIAAHLGLGRWPSLAFTHVIAEEEHAGRAWAWLFLPIIAIQLALIAWVPSGSTRLGLSLVCLVLVFALAAVWSGFRYYFTPRGLEIRALGFRLNSIPSDRIRRYTIERWRPICGYGIRGVGNSRAYVWGNRGVRIVTSDGYIFLGHDEPERIVRDLDAMMKGAKT